MPFSELLNAYRDTLRRQYMFLLRLTGKKNQVNSSTSLNLILLTSLEPVLKQVGVCQSQVIYNGIAPRFSLRSRTFTMTNKIRITLQFFQLPIVQFLVSSVLAS